MRVAVIELLVSAVCLYEIDCNTKTWRSPKIDLPRFYCHRFRSWWPLINQIPEDGHIIRGMNW